jgi:hypothetical protein
VKDIGNHRGAHDELDLPAAHAGLQQINLILRDDITLLNVNFMD